MDLGQAHDKGIFLGENLQKKIGAFLPPPFFFLNTDLLTRIHMKIRQCFAQCKDISSEQK